MSARKVCINHPSSYYSGKEQSPLHFGLSAEGYDINSIMEGFDKELWIVEVRNSKKVWTKKEHINKMTYEIPLITETTGDLRTGDLKECDASVAIVEPIVETVVLPSVATETVVLPSVATETVVAPSVATETVVAEDNKKTKPKARKTATAKPVAVAAKPAKDATSADTAIDAKPVADATDATVTTKPAATAATAATDYTLFITYRIQQLKKECADNKKNYDCARYEWKEYKNKPEELRVIMVAARQYASDDTK
uniref:Uncharacterized protein n=1 Tax=viral metagenome TaxID=1070528 RepID=A0A6C0CCR1_9ZZZZ